MTPRSLFTILAILIFISIIFTWDRYILRQDFKYFLTEEEVPDQFDIKSYQ